MRSVFHFLIYVHVCFVYIYICVPRACLVTAEARICVSPPRLTFHMVLHCNVVLGIEARSSERKANDLNCRAISSTRGIS